jgi:NTP pyrophosphatase (non-canonical NTP hydrolase)
MSQSNYEVAEQPNGDSHNLKNGIYRVAKWSYEPNPDLFKSDKEVYADPATNDWDWFQAECKKTAIYPEQDGLQYTALGMASEAGEVAGKIKKYMRDGTINDLDTAMEVFDVLWYCAAFLDELGYDMSEVIYKGVEKLRSRQERGVLGGSGDRR